MTALAADVRARIEQLLRDGGSDQGIARETGVSTRQIRNLRDVLDLPHFPRGKRMSPSLEHLFRQRAVPTSDGHMLWPTPNRAIGRGGRNHSVNRVAFSIGRVREPEGIVGPGCGVSGCVHPKHVEDQLDRDLYVAIFGEVG